ncbi:hypothetical protein pb186bvf_001453 [Paramecium bursaria]
MILRHRQLQLQSKSILIDHNPDCSMIINYEVKQILLRDCSRTNSYKISNTYQSENQFDLEDKKVYPQNPSLTRALEFKDVDEYKNWIQIIQSCKYLQKLMHNHSDQEKEEEAQIKPFDDTRASLRNKSLKKEKNNAQKDVVCQKLLRIFQQLNYTKPRESWVTRRLVSGREDIYTGIVCSRSSRDLNLFLQNKLKLQFVSYNFILELSCHHK